LAREDHHGNNQKLLEDILNNQMEPKTLCPALKNLRQVEQSQVLGISIIIRRTAGYKDFSV